ncbi:MAG: aspartate--tRNA(Asn) ligase [Candidatus Baldrarchaeia archaeon]
MEPLGDWRRTHWSSEITPALDGTTVTVCGWVHRIRDLGRLVFIVLRDREGVVQITIPKDKVPEHTFEKAKKLIREDVIAVRGKVRFYEKAPNNVEIIANEIRILNKVSPPLPLDPAGDVDADLDTRLNARIIDLRRPQTFAIFRINHIVLQSIREFLTNEGFIEVNTPKIIATATEGGTALFPVSYFGRQAFLAQSPQLYKEELTAALEKVFEIGPVFRAEEHNTTRHLCELVMVDLECAFATADDVMNILERLIAHVFREVKSKCSKELKILNREDLEVPGTPFPRYTYTQVLELLREHGIEIPWGEDLPTPALRKLGEILKGPYFITEWPTESKPFYIKPKDEDPKVSESFDFMWGWLELASGGTRIHNKELLIKRLKEQGLNPKSFEYHLRVFDWGMPPHAGWGLGLARLLMVICNVRNIRECVLFPRDKSRLVP